MIVKQQLDNFKQELHKEIDLIFKMQGEDDPDLKIKMDDFRKKSEQFYKKYFVLCQDTNDILFENDISIPLFEKERYRKQKTKTNNLEYDKKVMPVIETVNMLSCPGTYEFKEFSKMLSDSLKFMFTVYTYLYSMNLPKWIQKPEDIKNLNEPAIQLKKILNSFSEDLVLCFQTANIDPVVKIPLTLLYSSEVQNHANTKIAKRLASEDIAVRVAEKMLFGRNPYERLDMETILDSLKETNKLASGNENEHLQTSFRILIRIMSDLFISNLTAQLTSSPLKPKVLTTETKMKLIDIKNNLMRELQQSFDRIK